MPCPLVHGKEAVGIGGRGDDRDSPAEGRDGPCQIIGTAQMTGQQRHRKVSAFVHDHDCRVAGLAAAKRRDGPHRDAYGPHKDQGLVLGKRSGGPLCQRRPAVPAAGHRAGQSARQCFCQRQPGLGKGGIGAAHASAPLRNSVVKAGS